MSTEHLTRYPVEPYLSGYLLLTRDGERLSFHRTKSGALRQRRQLIESETEK